MFRYRLNINVADEDNEEFMGFDFMAPGPTEARNFATKIMIGIPADNYGVTVVGGASFGPSLREMDSRGAKEFGSEAEWHEHLKKNINAKLLLRLQYGKEVAAQWLLEIIELMAYVKTDARQEQLEEILQEQESLFQDLVNRVSDLKNKIEAITPV